MKILAILLLTFGFAYSQEYWDNVSGVREFVHDVYVDESNPNLILVSASTIPIENDAKDLFPGYYSLLKGSGLCISRDGGQNFNECNALDSSISLKVIRSKSNTNLLIASISNRNDAQFAFSTDDGLNWEIKDSECGPSPKIFDMVALEDRILAGGVSTGRGYFYSFDNFDTCYNVESLNVSVRDIDIQDGIVWMSSDNNAQSGVYRSDNLGNTWQKNTDGLQALRIHCVDASGVYQKWGVAHCGADQLVENSYVGKGIFITRDNGLSWDPVGADGCIVYDIEHHPKYPLFMAAACGTDGIYFSSDGGTSWRKDYNNGLPENADVRIIEIPNMELENGYVIYAGVFGEGLYKSKNIMPELTNIKTTNSDISFEILNTYPSPIIDYMSINVNSLEAGLYDVSLISMTGMQVLTMSDFLNVGENTISIDVNNALPNGMYLLMLSNKEESITKTVMIKR